MKLNYYQETDSLYIDFSEKISVNSCEVLEGIVIDYDENKDIVGIDIDNASRKIEFENLTLSRLPFQNQIVISA